MYIYTAYSILIKNQLKNIAASSTKAIELR